jgi:hypothetical protein
VSFVAGSHEGTKTAAVRVVHSRTALEKVSDYIQVTAGRRGTERNFSHRSFRIDFSAMFFHEEADKIKAFGVAGFTAGSLYFTFGHFKLVFVGEVPLDELELTCTGIQKNVSKITRS